MNSQTTKNTTMLQTETARETACKYADIIQLDRPMTEESLLKYPRMSLENRAKIFSPFAALRGYEQKIADEENKLLRVPFQELTEEEKEELSFRLSVVRKGMELNILYFVPDTVDETETVMGTYQNLFGQVTSIDSVEQYIRIGNFRIQFRWIRNISGNMIPEKDGSWD